MRIKINKKSFSALIVVFAIITGTVIQSCQTENINFIEPEQEAILNNFEKLVEKTASNLQGVSEKSINLSNAKSVSSKKEFQKKENQMKGELTPLVESSINSIQFIIFQLKGLFTVMTACVKIEYKRTTTFSKINFFFIKIFIFKNQTPFGII